MSLKKYVNAAWSNITKLQRYNSNAWQDCTYVKKYVNSAWTDIYNTKYLYNYGDECTEITGGFVSKYANNATGGTGYSGVPTLTKNSDNLQISIPNQTYAYNDNHNMAGLWHPANKIDLTNYTTLNVLCDMTYGQTTEMNMDYRYGHYIRVSDGPNLDSTHYASKYYRPTTGNKSKVTISVDVSTISGEYYVFFASARALNQTNFANNDMDYKIYAVWLE